MENGIGSARLRDFWIFFYFYALFRYYYYYFTLRGFRILSILLSHN